MKYAKSGKYVASIYEDLVAPYLQSDLSVETWGNGAGGLIPAECEGSYKVFSNLDIVYKDKSYSYTKDHSKYGITIDSSKNTVFLGDMNRMQS